MTAISILYPVVLLVALTFTVLALVPIYRFRSGFRGELTMEDFRMGESSRVPDRVALPNRNYMNLLELPLLFYTGAVLAYVLDAVTPAAFYLAWLYAGLRVVHSAIHLTYNNVAHRLVAFASSVAVLLAFWVVLATKILG